jgi:pimeloyl-ACP methyl ester carboxylesterase
MYNPFKDRRWMIRANMRGFGVPAEYYEQFAADTRAATVDSLAAIFRANMSFTIPAGLAKVTGRVLLTVGAKEYGVMKRSAQKLAAAIPGAKAYTVRDVAHNWPLTYSDLYTRVLSAWVSDAPLPDDLIPLA